VATVPALPGERLAGTVSFIHPHLDPLTRTALVRMELPNPGMRLRQDMYATLEMEVELAPRALLAPRDAVIDTGTEQVVFLALPGGRFEPRRVRLGAGGDDGQVEILAGLASGDTVVTTGQFLLDAESNFRTALQRFLDLPAPEGGPATSAPAKPGAHVH
jgi:multidrug efflux pump subunit AcrA (membrane-fusion protein)